MTQPTTITLAGHSHTLTADNPAKIRFQASGGRVTQLFDADHSYLHTLRLVHAVADQPLRERYPTTEALAEVLPDTGPEADSIYEATFALCHAAGWFLTAEQLQANIEKAQAELEEGSD